MAAPSFAFTISRAAETLGELEEMNPEDGYLWIHGIEDQQTNEMAHTKRNAPGRWRPGAAEL
jgi:hypothetical protein